MVISAFLVEDRPDIRDTLVDAMQEVAPLKFIGLADTEAAAHQWLGANDGAWALAIVDLYLGQGSGFGVLKDCQARAPWQKVVVLTSYAQPNVSMRCHELGADAVFDKSHDIEELVRFCHTHAANLEGSASGAAQPGEAAQAGLH